MVIPKAIQNLIDSFERLPGVGPKTAQRLTFYLLHVPQGELDKFASSLQNLKKDTILCSECYMIDESSPCSICRDSERDHSVVCVVEQPLDVLALEKSGRYKGIYHVLHGKIDPLNNIGPDEIYINQLISRIKNPARLASESVTGRQKSRLPKSQSALQAEALQAGGTGGQAKIKEIILATNPTMEGEATAMYIAKRLSELKTQNLNLESLKVSRIGRGLPIGADLEYADEVTLQRAMEGRNEY